MAGSGSGSVVTGTSIAGGLVTAPASEPVSVQDLKEHLLLDSGAFDDNLDPEQSIVPGDHVVAAAYSLEGASADILGYSAEVILDSGTNAAGGTVDAKIQDSDDDATWTDWTGGAFVQVTTANDNAIQKIAYTGTRQFIRVVVTVAVDTCDFGVSIIKYSSDTTQDTLLSALITAARQQVEAITQRKLITQTWEIFMDTFPTTNQYIIPFGNLQSVSSIKYTDSDGTESTMTVTTEYLVDVKQEPGRIVLPYGASWPSFTPYPVNPIITQFVCGYGNAAANVPSGLKTAIKMIAENAFNHRDSIHEIISSGAILENKAVMAFISPFRMWTEI